MDRELAEIRHRLRARIARRAAQRLGGGL
jgi:hypothetical protein